MQDVPVFALVESGTLPDPADKVVRWGEKEKW